MTSQRINKEGHSVLTKKATAY